MTATSDRTRTARALWRTASTMPRTAVAVTAVLWIAGLSFETATGWALVAIVAKGLLDGAAELTDPSDRPLWRRFLSPLFDLAIGGAAVWWLLIR